jgi:hypothetical protein
MKKSFFLLSFVVLLFAAIQTAEAQISLGIGTGSRVYTFQEGNAPAMPGAAPTISIEFEANFRLSRVFGVSVGADLAGVAGYHFMNDKSKNLGDIYLEAPVRAKLYIPLGSKVDLYIFGGPVASVNLISGDFHTTQITDNYKANPNLRRFDVMLGGGVGVEIIRHIRATVGYDHGLINRDGTPGRNVHTGALKVAAYYMF